jgi:hypothetical protein
VTFKLRCEGKEGARYVNFKELGISKGKGRKLKTPRG